MRPSMTVALLGILLCLLCPTWAYVGNCSQVPAKSLFSDTAGFLISPLRLEVFPALNGARASAFGLIFEPYLYVERNRSLLVTDDTNCVYPAGNGDSFNAAWGDLLLNDTSSNCSGWEMPCGTLFNYMYPSELDCTTEEVTGAFYNVSARSVYIYFTHPSYPGFKITFSAVLVNESLTVYPFDDPQNPAAIKYVYDPESLKFSYKFENWPWTVPPGNYTTGRFNNAPFFVSYYNVTAITGPSVVNYIVEPYEYFGSYVSANGSISMDIHVPTGQVVDGLPYNLPRPVNELENITIPFDFLPNALITLPSILMNLHVCQDNVTLWNSVDFDPTLSAAFGVDPSNFAKGPTAKLNAGVQAAIITVVVIVIASLGTFVGLVLFVPAIRYHVLPGTRTMKGVAKAQASKKNPNVVASDASSNSPPPGSDKGLIDASPLP